MLATVIVFAATALDHLVPILVALAIGTAIGVVGAYRVQMTQMPQLVALFNGVGGGAAAIVALIELDQILFRLTAGDIPDAAGRAVHPGHHGLHPAGRGGQLRRLDRDLPQAPGADDHPPGHLPGLPGGLRPRPGRRGRAAPSRWCSIPGMVLGVLLVLVGAGLGVLLVLPVGGADVPIVISLLNAFTGLTVAASGYLLENTLLLVAGTLVGSAGTLLTRLMANAMGRSLFSTLFGALKGGSTQGSTAAQRPAGQGRRRGGRGDPARVRRARDHRARATAWPWPRPSTR